MQYASKVATKGLNQLFSLYHAVCFKHLLNAIPEIQKKSKIIYSDSQIILKFFFNVKVIY